MSAARALLAGAGVATESLEALDLMELASTRAGIDAGSERLLEHIDAVLVPAGTWPYSDPGRELARRLGCPGATSILAQLGVSQQGLINEALLMISARRAQAVLVVGGESRRYARSGAYSDASGDPDVTLQRPDDFVDPSEITAGIAFPAVRSYAMIERAYSHERGLTATQTDIEIADLQASMSVVASHNPAAAFGTARTSRDLATPSKTNTLLAAPYLRWHASQWTVDQAAALLFLSDDVARSAGLDRDRCIWPAVALESSDAVALVKRRDLGRWPAMGVLGALAEQTIGHPLAEIPYREVYSCFPAAVRVQCTELNLPIEPVPTLSGGMTFAGGPFNNFVLQSLASMVPTLRQDPGSSGLVTTVSGLLTKPGLGIWSTMPGDEPPIVRDLAGAAARATARLEVASIRPSRVTIDSSTAFFEDNQPVAVVIGHDSDGHRSVVRLEDEAAFERFSRDACIGEEVDCSIPPPRG